jgi:hypothetical protein
MEGGCNPAPYTVKCLGGGETTKTDDINDYVIKINTLYYEILENEKEYNSEDIKEILLLSFLSITRDVDNIIVFKSFDDIREEKIKDLFKEGQKLLLFKLEIDNEQYFSEETSFGEGRGFFNNFPVVRLKNIVTLIREIDNSIDGILYKEGNRYAASKQLRQK